MSIKLGIKRRARHLFGKNRTGPPAGAPMGGAPWAAVVEVIYQTALARAPDPSGLATYSAAMSSGKMSPTDVLADLYKSGEGRRVYANKTTDLLLPALYDGLLRRSPSDDELAHWRQRMLDGATLSDIVREMVGTPEVWRSQLNHILQHQGMPALFLAEYRRRGTIDG